MARPTQERLQNIEANMASVSVRVPLPQKPHGHPIQLVCYGPSLRGTWERIDRTKRICTVSGAHNFLRERGIIPTLHVEFDWRAHKAKHISDPIVTAFWIASCCHPDLVKKVPDPSLWHAEQTVEEGKFIKQRETGAFLVPGGSCAGLRAIEVLYAAGFRHFDIFGMDSSFDEDGRHAGPHYGEHKSSTVDVPVGGKVYKSSFAFMRYIDEFRYCRKLHPDCLFNLHGDGLLQAMFSKEMAA